MKLIILLFPLFVSGQCEKIKQGIIQIAKTESVDIMEETLLDYMGKSDCYFTNDILRIVKNTRVDCLKDSIIKYFRHDTQEAQAGRIATDLVNAFYDLQGDKTGGQEWEIAKDMAKFAVKEMKKVSKNHRFLDMVIKQIKAQVYD